MSVFKTLGNKLKRVVSLKNALNLVGGKYVDVLGDVKRVATTGKPKGKSIASQATFKNFEFPTEVMEVALTKERDFVNNVSKSIASSKIVQDNINGTNRFMTKVWWQATWTKNKKMILIVAGLVVVFVGYKFMNKPQRRIVRRR